jgi:hypothetical protein
MPDFKNMTVEALREIARKVVGKGYSRLKTKTDLVQALEAAEKKVASATGKATARIRAATERAANATEKAAKQVAAAAEKVREAARPKGGKAKPSAEATGGRAAPAERPEKKAAPPQPAPPVREDAGLDPEGYFVARVRGEEAARQAPHPMTESAAEERRPAPPPPLLTGTGLDVGLGELPWSYEDDAFVALPRDPRTLFLYWDYARSTLAQGFAGLEDARAQIWILAGTSQGQFERVRTIDFALESRSYYIHDLEPGRSYRAEIHVVDRAGRERLLGSPSNDVGLPPIGPSPVIDDRFARIPWDLPLKRWMREGHAGAPFSEEARALLARLSDWSRFSGRVWGGSAGGMGGRPFSPSGGPSSPSPTGKEGA